MRPWNSCLAQRLYGKTKYVRRLNSLPLGWKACGSPNQRLQLLLAFVVFQSLISPAVCQEGLKRYFSIEENLPAGSLVGVISDSSGYTYDLATQTQYFSVNQLSGEISVKKIIDREQLINNEIKFVVKQNHPSSPSIFIEVIVLIIDINDNSPRFTSNTLNYTITENDVPIQPFTLTANDADFGVNGSLTYSIISGNEKGYWKLTTSTSSGQKTGALMLVKQVDREEIPSFRLVVEARDGAASAKTGTAVVNIVVRDLNDNHPTFDLSLYHGVVLENATVGSKVLETQADDPDEGLNSALVYSITQNKLFSIDSFTGEVLLKAALHNSYYSSEASCQSSYCNTTLCLTVCVLEIWVVDQEGLGSTQLRDQSRVKIIVEDVNDHAPIVIISGKQPPTVSEDAPINSRAVSFVVRDEDKGENGRVSLAISSGNELGHFKTPVCISKFCFLFTKELMDKEQISSYNLTLVASDYGVNSLSSTISITVIVLDANDHSPVFSSAAYFAVVSELNPVDSFVAAVTATDADEDENGRITYQISQGNNYQFFKINSDSGLVTVNRRVDSDQLDVPQIILNVSASDHGSKVLRTETTLTVNIIDENDEVPTFTQLEYYRDVTENNDINMTLITMVAIDRDKGANGSVKYRISEVTANTYPGLFHIHPDTGVLSISKSLDREERDSYVVEVVAYDQGTVISLSSQATLYINVTDENDNRPIFYPSRYYAVIPKSASVGHSVLFVSANDDDVGDNGRVIYSLTSHSSLDSLFSVDAATGELSLLATLPASPSSYVLEINAADTPGTTNKATCTVEVKIGDPEERDPVFTNSSYTYFVFEDASGTTPNIGQLVATISARAETVITYAILDGDPDGVFTIGARSGEITTTKGLDRDDVAAYRLTVVARGISKLAFASVNIIIEDENDNSPEFTQIKYTIRVPEDTPPHSVVFVAQAKDRDAGKNAKVTYTISANAVDSLVIDQVNGAVSLRDKLQVGNTLRFTVTATDRGAVPRFNSAEVVLIAEDVNDHSPVFEHREYSVAVNESSLINHQFLRLTATDDDEGENAHVTYSLISGVSSSRPEFGVFPDGSLYVAQKLDRESKGRYRLLVQATDGGQPTPRTDIALVHVKILDNNDNYPEFSSPSYEFRVLEGRSAGVYIGSVSARDDDVGRNSDLMYFFTTNQHSFDLDPFTGEIRSKKEFDREAVSKYDLTVQAVDNGITKRSTQARVSVIVEDVNDNKPKFTKTDYDVQISEAAYPGQMINPVSAEDEDLELNGAVEYYIIGGNEKGHFRIDEDTGSLSVEGVLDRERQSDYKLMVEARDGGQPPLSSVTTVHITLLDANNQSPEFDRPSYSVNVNEDAEVGVVVATITATDGDLGVNAIIHYSITQGNAEDVFEIVEGTGEVKLARRLDYENKQLYILSIVAANRAPESLTAQTRLSINVLDVNDNSPRFTNDIVSVSIPENTNTSTPVVTVSANDSDSGVNGKVLYSITSQPQPAKFSINSNGVIFASSSVDRESSDTDEVSERYTLEIEATDQAIPASSRLSAKRTIIIMITDINDNAPYFVSPSTGVILENSVSGTEVMTVQARDKDKGRNQQITYSLRSGTGLFYIDATSGLITLIRSIPLSPVIQSITVRAADNGQPQRSTEQSINIIVSSSLDSGLAFTQPSYQKDILETFPANKNIIQVQATESNVEYYITRVTSLGQSQPTLFSISPESGQIQRAMPLDRDQGYVTYIVEIYARDKVSVSPRTAKAYVTITLLDVNDSIPKFSADTYTVECDEGAAIGYLLTTITAVDPDENAHLSYTISPDSQEFTVSDRGEVRVNKPLDRETTPVYHVTLSASDSTYSSSTELIVSLLDINDEMPVFSRAQYSLSVSEKATPGVTVGSVKAVDDDLGVGGEVKYRILSTWGSDLFSINSQTGLITLEGSLDFEEVQLYVIQVEAADQDPVTPLTSNVTVYINVIDENDNAPAFSPSSYSALVSEDVMRGELVITVTAFDDDAGMNGEVEYTILSNDVPFVIDSRNGSIYTSRHFDREELSEYMIIVKAEDYATKGALSSTAEVKVMVGDINDNEPSLQLPHMFYVSELTAPDTVVATVTAEDLDLGTNAVVTYTLLTTTPMFSLNPSSGELKLLQTLDREGRSAYELKMRAVDGGTPALSSTVDYTVIVEDANDNPPVFSATQLTSVEVREDQVAGEVLLTLSAEDADTGLAAEIRYYIIGGDPNEDFHLDQFSGKLSVNRGLDYERIKSYTLTIQAEDLGVSSQSSTIDIDVRVLDWNDSPPVFLHSPYNVYLQEESLHSPVQLTKVEVFDPDSAPYNESYYELVFGLDDDSQLSRSIFSINSTTGVISAGKPVNREETSKFTLKVVARNIAAGSELSGEAIVEVTVRDINDHPPIFDLPIYSTKIVEGLQLHREIIQVTASDLDLGSNGEVRYALYNDSAAEYFTIDYVTGWITNVQTLDREVNETYELTVIAHDLGDVSQSSMANVKVILRDINDNAPSFTQEQLSVELQDPTEAGQFVVGSTAVDYDLGANGSIVYSLHGVSDGLFNLDTSTGVVLSAQRLTSSSPSFFTIRATDGGGKSSELSVNITFRRYATSAQPVFQDLVSSIRLSEGKAVNSQVLRFTATPSVPGNTILYSIAGGNTANTFMVGVDGQLILTRALDYSLTPAFDLWIEARDASTEAKSYEKVVIMIADENNHTPEFEQALYMVSVVEEENVFDAGLLLKVTATDRDSGLNGTVTYSLLSGNVDDPFILEPDGSLVRTKRLDRERIARYSLLIQAKDGGGLTSTTIVIVNVEDINDMFPRFDSAYRWSVAEDMPVGSIISSVSATDADVGINAEILYSMHSPSSHFAITPSGNVTLTAKLDRENVSSYEVVVSAKNVEGENGISGSTTIQIQVTDVNDNAPEFLPAPTYSFTFTEQQPVGSVVGQLNTEDQDEEGPNSLVKYQLVSPSSFFLIDPMTGEIKSKDVLEFDVTEIHNSYMLHVEARDHGVPSHTAVALVNISIVDANDHAPQFSQTSYFVAVPDDIAVNTEVLTVNAADDLDYHDNALVSYSIVGGNGSSLFKVEGSTGKVSVSESVVGKTGEYHTLTLQAADHGQPVQSSHVTVTVLITPENRFSPRWVTPTPLEYDVSESEEAGYEIAVVRAGDSDEGINSAIVYSIVSGSHDADLLSIDPQTGRIILSKALDYEKLTQHQVTLRAQDKAFYPEKIYTVLTLNVLDTDDNPPVFTSSSYTAYVSENSHPDSLVTKVSAVDADEGDNGIVRYSIIEDGSSHRLFSIDSVSGEIIAKAVFDYEESSEYRLSVKAVNPKSSAYTSTALLTVYVRGVNEYSPKFIQKTYTFDVSESAQVGHVLGDLTATDEDEGADGQLLYILTGESNEKGFSLDITTGRLTVAEILDRESVATIVLHALVKNPGPVKGNDTDTATIWINLDDANDSPRFNQLTYNGSVGENQEPAVYILTVSATDSDQQANNRKFSYALEDDFGQFSIDSENGRISTTRSLNREEKNEYMLVAQAIDQGRPPLTGQAIVHVHVTDVNDESPYFLPPTPEGSVIEGAEADTPVLRLSSMTYDDDIPPNQGPYTYSLNSPHFYINQNSGTVFTKNVLFDYEVTKSYTLTVDVTDSGGRTSQLSAKVNVEDENDEPSEPRDLTIVIQSYGPFVDGAVASVEPLDVDVVGDYSCSISSHPVFSLPGAGCQLLARDLKSDASLTVNGHDGVHDTVQSTVNVKVKPYTNRTLDSTIVTRVSGVSIEEFVELSELFISSVEEFTFNGESVRLLSMRSTGNYIDLYLVLETADGSPSTSLASLLSANKEDISRKSGVTVSTSRRNVCTVASCSGNGDCRSQVVVFDQLDYTSTASFTLTYQLASLQPLCVCEPQYIGESCSDEAKACISSPCMHGARCLPVGESDFQCVCTEFWQGAQCEKDVDECLDPDTCLNGGSCTNVEGSFQCGCTEHYRGVRCEERIRCETRNPCHQTATCVDLPTGGYQCNCAYGYYGLLCNQSSFGFQDGSYMQLPSESFDLSDIKMTLATKSMNALLLFQQGVDSQFLALQISDGSVTFTFRADQGQSGVTVSKTVASGSWYRIHATRTSTEATLEVVFCKSASECSTPCNKQVDCYSSVSLGQGLGDLTTSSHPLYIAGTAAIDTVLQFRSVLSSATFIGCIGDLQIDDRPITIDDSQNSFNVRNTCPQPASHCSSLCGEENECRADWFSTLCACPNFYSQLSCTEALIDTDVSVSQSSAFIYKYLESYRRDQLLNTPSSRIKRQITADSSRLSVRVRTGVDGVIMSTIPYSANRELKLRDGLIMYGSVTNAETIVTDGKWHDISLVVTDTSTLLSVDGKVAADNSSAPHDFLDLYTVSQIIIADVYQGCISDLIVNGDRLPMSAAVTDKFDISVSNADQVMAGCDGCPLTVDICGQGKACDAVSAACIQMDGTNTSKQSIKPWMWAVIIVGSVVFVLAVVLVTVYGCRRLKPDRKSSGTMKGSLPIITSQFSKSNETSGGLDNLTDADILASEQPDVRVFNNMSPALPGLRQQSSRTLPSPYPQLDDSTVIIEGSVTGGINAAEKYNTDQFYDFDESASIAPSDVDIRKYYKGYRKGDNIEMQMIPKHMRQETSKLQLRLSPKPHIAKDSPQTPGYAMPSPAIRQSPLVVNSGYDANRQETPISQLQQRCLRQTPIDELNKRIALEQRRDSESSLTDGSSVRQPHWTHARTNQTPGSRPSSRQNRAAGRHTPSAPLISHISAQRQQDLNRLSHRSASSSIDSDDDITRRQPMERNIYSEAGDSSSDESSNDSFTASEFEADEPKVRNDYQPTNMMFTKLQEVEDESDMGDPNAYRTTFSWDGLRNVDTSLQRFINNSDTDLDSVSKNKRSPVFRWDHFFSWGTGFEKLAGVFADIAELPHDHDDDIDIQSSRDSGEYV